MGNIDVKKFNKAKDDYYDMRRKYKNEIITKLRARTEFIRVTNIQEKKRSKAKREGVPSGEGYADYTSNNILKPPFDLSSWMWISARRKGFRTTAEFLISLNPLETDPGTGNTHSLYDRISFSLLEKGHELIKIVTQYELPLDETAMDNLVEDFIKFSGAVDKFLKEINSIYEP
jgi:hypothetical protein